MSAYREVNRRDWEKTLLYVFSAATIMAVSGIALGSTYIPYGLILWTVMIVGATLFLLVRWHASTTAYRCRVCRNEFEISALTDFLMPHIPSGKYLKCPKCGKRNWATELIKQN